MYSHFVLFKIFYKLSYAYQAPIRDTGARGANSKDVKLESVDISIGTK